MNFDKPIELSYLDPAVSPAEDFYHYANGGWLQKHAIPDEFSRYGSFDKLREENREIVRSIIGEVAASAATSHDHISTIVGDFYRTGMDVERINSLGFEPIKKDLQRIDDVKSTQDIPKLIANFYARSIPTVFYIYPSPDRENSDHIIASLHQGGMGLSEVEYYRNNDKHSKDIRKNYLQYIAKMFRLTGVEKSESEEIAAVILAMETRLAWKGMTRLEQRDPHKTFNKQTPDALEVDFRGLDWKLLFERLKVNTGAYLNVDQPEFFAELSAMVADIPVDQWKIYLKWRLINGAANLLSLDFEMAKFNFYGKFLSGKKQIQPRWKRVTSATEDALGEAIGKLFVAKYFPPEARERMISLVENLRIALREKIRELEWMSESTKTEALEKLSRIRVKIGYPDKWRSYNSLTFSNKSYFDNYRTAAIFNLEHELDKIGKPADKDEWHMTPQTVNAYYHPLLNEIVFPAGILQPPFFYNDADDAVNYGAIGVVIGHEMTHGFDDQGRKFDKSGNLNDWWTKEDAANFNRRAKVLEEQFNRIRISADLYADGKLSLGENIADLGGVNIALMALRNAWQAAPPEPVTDGFTPMQRFFLAYAHIWANNIRKKEMIRLTKEDVHSLGINRVNGPLPNVNEFLEAFGITEGDRMYLPENQRASIW
ncbi:MAG: M13 family metallopeptidase [Bacteroidales bacterium]